MQSHTYPFRCICIHNYVCYHFIAVFTWLLSISLFPHLVIITGPFPCITAIWLQQAYRYLVFHDHFALLLRILYSDLDGWMCRMQLQKAAKLIDSGVVRATKFLWRYPTARVLLVFYLVKKFGESNLMWFMCKVLNCMIILYNHVQVFVHLFLMYLLHHLQVWFSWFRCYLTH